MKKLLFLFVLMLSPMLASANDGDTFSEETVEGVLLKYTIISESEKTCMVGNKYYPEVPTARVHRGPEKEVCQASGDITIPKEANGYKVVRIECFAFNQAAITSVFIPNSVESIGGSAFTGCADLKSVKLPEQLRSLESETFYGCKSLTSIDIPEGVTSIGDYAFANCEQLKEINIPSGVEQFGKCVFWNTGFTSLPKLPESLTVIPKSMFYECTQLTSIEIPKNITIIEECAFGRCPISEIEIPASVTHIGVAAFANCKNITDLTIPDNVTEIGFNAFWGCSNLKTVKLSANITCLNKGVFSDCYSLKDFYCYAEKVPEAESSAFGNTNIKEVTLHVPAASVSAYQATEPWKNFKEIVALEDQDDYRPFVKVGKKWDMIRSDFDGNYHHINYRLTNEKVEKAGKTYMKMYRRENYSTVADDERLLREENRKVYIFDPDMQKEFLLFDYSLKAGDTYETYSYDEQKMVSYKVLSVSNFTEGPESIRYDYDEERDSMITQRRYLRKWTVCRTDDNSLQKTWIEGIGSLEGPLANLYASPISFKDDLAYVEDNYYYYLPFSFHNEFSHVHGCNLPTGAEDYKEDDERHKLTYELEGNRLHVYGKAFTQCGPNNYAYFYEKKTDDPLVNKIEFVIQEAEPMADCMALHATNFYVPGFDPNMNYIVRDNQGEEHPVINKTSQMDYRPLVEEGKVWKVGASTTIVDNSVQVVDYYYFDGDTIIGGKTCKQMMCQRYVSPNYSDEYWTPRPSLTKVGAWYEEDKKVYFYEEILHFMRMKYDFSLGANDTLQLFDTNSIFILGPKQTGGIKGFKGVYREVMLCDDEGQTFDMATWLEGVGGLMGPIRDDYNDSGDRASFLMSCTVGDEVIYLNDKYEDGATPEGARKNRFDFTHTIKTKPKAPRRSENLSLYGEYNDMKLGINLNPLDDAYQVRITDESGKVVYEKAINAGNIVGLNIDISAYAKGRYTVTVENSEESFTGEFNAQATGIEAIINNKVEIRPSIYNLQGQRLSSLQKGLNIVNGQKIFVK